MPLCYIIKYQKSRSRSSASPRLGNVPPNWGVRICGGCLITGVSIVIMTWCNRSEICGGQELNYLIVALMWSGFGVIHSFLISFQFSSWAKHIMGRYFSFFRLIYNLFSITLFVVLLSFTKTLDTELVIKFIPPWMIIQQVLMLASGAVIIWAFLSYDYLEFIGIRQIIDRSKKKDFAHPKTITKKGLLGIVRHPMYSATIIFMWSLDSTRADILTHIVLTIYILVGIIFEERKLVKQHGSAYTKYQEDVPALIPFTKK